MYTKSFLLLYPPVPLTNVTKLKLTLDFLASIMLAKKKKLVGTLNNSSIKSHHRHKFLYLNDKKIMPI